MKRFFGTAGVLAALVLMPGVASAQSAISGLVTDTSGGILPGVTVEASSDVAHRKSAVGCVRRPGTGTAWSICVPASTR